MDYDDMPKRDIDFEEGCCVNNDDLGGFLTLGKVYKCYLTDNRVVCTDDWGESNTFYKERFDLLGKKP